MPDKDITVDGNLTNETSPAVTDRILLIKNSDGELYDITLENLLKVLNGLTEDTSPDESADFLLTFDTSAGGVKKTKPSSISFTSIRSVHTQTGELATGTTTIPSDDTLPQNTEGDQYLSLSITPTNAANKLLIEACLFLSSSAVGRMTISLFQDSTANSLAVQSAGIDAANSTVSISLTYEMTAGTTSATTFKIRAGNYAAGTTSFNGISGSRHYGGAINSFLRITETTIV